MPQHPRSVSVCICTRNRPDTLTATLESIERSSVPLAQVVVSDDSTDDRTRSVIETRFPSVAYRRGPRQGLGANRNAAVAIATGDHILFLDDDCLLGERFVETALDELGGRERPETSIVAGAELKHGVFIRANDQSFLGFQNRPYRDGEARKTVVINATLFPRSLFELVQFDEHLVYGYDEVDVTTQAIAQGYEIAERVDALNHHFPSAVNRDYYGWHANSARLYVTFKRYRWTERRPLKARLFFVVAVVHVVLTMAREGGVEGLKRSPGVIHESVASIRAAA